MQTLVLDVKSFIVKYLCFSFIIKPVSSHHDLKLSEARVQYLLVVEDHAFEYFIALLPVISKSRINYAK